jgi:hypothetical protein
MTNQLFAAALGITAPWFVQTVDFDAGQRRLTIHVDFVPGRFAHAKAEGEHKVHDTQIKRLRHLNFFQHECYLEVRVPRVKLPDAKVALVEPDWVGRLAGFTLLFEALVLMLAQQMPFAAVARTIGESWHRVHAICRRYVDLALAGPTCRRSRALPSTRRPIGAATAISRWWPMPMPAKSCSSAKAAAPTTSPASLARPQRRTGQHRRGLHRHVAGLHQRRHRPPAKGHDYLRQVPRGGSCEPSRGPDAANAGTE